MDDRVDRMLEFHKRLDEETSDVLDNAEKKYLAEALEPIAQLYHALLDSGIPVESVENIMIGVLSNAFITSRE